MVGVRLAPFLLIVCIGLLLDRFFGWVPKHHHEKPNTST